MYLQDAMVDFARVLVGELVHLTVGHDSSTFLAFSRFSYSSSMRLCNATLCAMISSSAEVRARLSRSLKRLSHLRMQESHLKRASGSQYT